MNLQSSRHRPRTAFLRYGRGISACQGPRAARLQRTITRRKPRQAAGKGLPGALITQRRSSAGSILPVSLDAWLGVGVLAVGACLKRRGAVHGELVHVGPELVSTAQHLL